MCLKFLPYAHNPLSGWIAGSINTKDFDLRMLSVELRLSIVNVDYRYASRFTTRRHVLILSQARPRASIPNWT